MAVKHLLSTALDPTARATPPEGLSKGRGTAPTPAANWRQVDVAGGDVDGATSPATSAKSDGRPVFWALVDDGRPAPRARHVKAWADGVGPSSRAAPGVVSNQQTPHLCVAPPEKRLQHRRSAARCPGLPGSASCSPSIVPAACNENGELVVVPAEHSVADTDTPTPTPPIGRQS